MEKISGILPSSSRVARVDLQSAASVRSGTPAFGQKVAKSSLNGNRMAMSTAEKAVTEWNRLKDERTRRQEKIVTDIAKDFFHAPPIPQLGKDSAIADTINNVPAVVNTSNGRETSTLKVSPQVTDELSPNLLLANNEVNNEEFLDMPDKGGYLDVVA